MTAAPRVVSTSAVAALVLVTVWLFWPAALGGGTTYLNTYGSSMEPGFSAGDLAVLSEAGSYSVGDVVAYRSESLGTVVMHRIVAADADGFVTQGDNNDFLDEDRPTRDEIMGRLFFRVPHGGSVLASLTSPWTLTVVGLATVLVVGVATSGRQRTRRSRRRRAPALSLPSLSLPSLSMPSLSVPAFAAPALSVPRLRAGDVPVLVRARARQVALAATSVALVAVVGAGVLFLLPSTETASETVAVTEQGEFSYGGTAVRGTTYPTGVIEAGDTVWTKLATGLTVSYASTLTGPDLAAVQGALRLDVSVEAPDGWGTYLNSGAVVALQNGAATATVAVDTARASAVLEDHYAEVGGAAGGATLRITPTTATSGTVRGIPFEADGPATLDFALDPTSLRLAGDADALSTRTETQVTTDQVVARTFEVLAVAVPIGLARGLAVAVLALALLTAGGAAWLSRSGRGDAADAFVLRHADRIVPVAAFAGGGTVIDVSDAESLHRVAERFDTVVLHHAGADEDTFAVRDVDATYRFVVPGAAERRRGRPPVPAARAAAHAYEPDLTSPLPRAGGLRGRLA